MGAASSVRQIYKDASDWFAQYFDDESFVADFHSIDRDHDGAIRYQELVAWLQEKANSSNAGTASAWRFFVVHPEIVAIAHSQTGRLPSALQMRHHNIKRNEKIVDLSEFKDLLVQLFVVSVMWTHFKKADEWNSQNRPEAHDGRLTEDEFILAVKTFTAAYMQEELSEEQLRNDFKSLDLDGGGTVSLLEICSLCAKFIDPVFAQKMLLPEGQKVIHEIGEDYMKTPSNIRAVAEAITSASTADISQHNSAFMAIDAAADEERHRNTSMALMNEIQKNENIAEFMEMKIATEKLIADANVSVL